jgi:hypothetical protein
MGTRVGFVKKHVTELAYATRDELGLRPWDRLDPLVLAEHLAIPVWPLSDLRNADPTAADVFLITEKSAFSAVTVFAGPARVVIHNDSHSPARQASNICHELSHGLLLHEPAPALNGAGCRDWDQVMEDQAQWMAGALLVHESGLIAALRRGKPHDMIAAQFGVSQDMISWRINTTGALRRARAASRS